MANYKNSNYQLRNPSELIMDIDTYLKFYKEFPNNKELLNDKETGIFADLGPRHENDFDNLLIQSIDLKGIEDQVNNQFRDGIDFEDEQVDYPFFRTARRETPIADPFVEEKLNVNRKSPSIKFGKCDILENNNILINRFNGGYLLALSSEFDTGVHKK